MKTLHLSGLALLGLALATHASAQQLLQPTVPAATPPASGPQLKQSQPVAPAAVPSAPGVRQAPAAIRDKGPADETPAAAIGKAAAPDGRQARVLDPSGVPVSGYIQVAPNRVYDPATRRYHWTVRTGDQQKIVK